MEQGDQVIFHYRHVFFQSHKARTKCGTFISNVRHSKTYRGPQMAVVILNGNANKSRVPLKNLGLICKKSGDAQQQTLIP